MAKRNNHTLPVIMRVVQVNSRIREVARQGTIVKTFKALGTRGTLHRYTCFRFSALH